MQKKVNYLSLLVLLCIVCNMNAKNIIASDSQKTEKTQVCLQENLFPNSDFNDFAGEIPLGWTFKSWNREFTKDRIFKGVPGCDGSGSCLELVFGNAAMSSSLSLSPIEIKENQYYALNGNYSSTFGTVTKIQMIGSWLNNQGKEIGSFTFALPDTQNEWCPFFDEAKSPSGSTHLSFKITMKWDDGRIRFDKFSLREGSLKDYKEEFYPAIKNGAFFPIYGWIPPTVYKFYNEKNKYPRNAAFFDSDKMHAEYAAANFTVGVSGAFGTKKLLRWVDTNDILEKAVGNDTIWGFMGKDEPQKSYFPTLVEQRERISKFAENKPVFNNLLPMYGFKSEKPYEEYIDYVTKYIEQVKPTFITVDHYPLVGNNQKYEPSWFNNLEIMRKMSKQANIHFGVFCGSSAVCGVRSPNDAEMRWEAFTSLAYGARFLGWFTFLRQIQGEGLRDTIIDEYGNRTSHYSMVKRINCEVLTLAPTLLQLESTGVYHSEVLRPQATPSAILPPAAPISESSLVAEVNDGEVVLGEFIHVQDKQMYFMMVNRDFTKNCSPKLNFKKNVTKLSEVSKLDGKLITVPEFRSNTNMVNLNLASGDGRLFCIE